MDIQEVPCMVSALEEEGKILELHFAPEQRKEILGNIYVAQVQRIMTNIDAAFVQIQKGLTCYYSLKEKDTAIYAQPYEHEIPAVGDQIIVQVAREGMRGKAPSVTTKLNFTGTYLVLTTDSRQIAFSTKIVSYDRQWLKELLEPLMDGTFGIIVRTNAKTGKPKEILREFKELQERLDYVRQQGKSRVCYSLLDEAEPFYRKILRNVYAEGLEEIVTDLPDLHKTLQYLPGIRQLRDHCQFRLYEDPLLPLYKLYRLESAFEDIQKERIWLDSGGFLVIQQTEAFVSIDVNSGKFTGRKKAEETFRKINLEAAAQIAYQLRLRNLSGIILIDFINMSNPAYKEELLNVLQKHLKKDPIRAAVIDMTKLNIVEVTRKKVRRPLFEELCDLKEERYAKF